MWLRRGRFRARKLIALGYIEDATRVWGNWDDTLTIAAVSFLSDKLAEA
jgi:hypothetical protein